VGERGREGECEEDRERVKDQASVNM